MSDGNSSFLRAARDGNLSEVLEYLKGSTDINTSNSNGLNALHLASKEGHINIVTELLRRGANVEAATKKGNTALHIASLAGHEEIVKILVQNGAKVNVQSMTGFTPLYMAAQEGHSEVVKFLLDNGASQSLATVDGFTPLAVALQQGHDKVVAVLLEHDTKGKVRLPALHIAAKKDDIGSANLLLQNDHNADSTTKSGGLVNDTTKSGFTPLHIAAHYGNVNVGTLLIQRGADVNYKAKNNITPLHVASRWGKSNMVTLLLDHEAVIEERTRDGLTPLHCAARSGHENVVDLLLERGAPFSAKTKNGLTPLHMAAQGDHVDCARLLLYHKAPVDDVTVDYLTPLHVAAHCGNVKTAKLLLDRKSDPNARALNGFTPLHIACKKNRIKVVELLLKYGASIEATTESGLTPLHVASFMGHMNISIYLIQHNANPDYPTVRGETALHLAARANQTDIIRILLRNGATVDAKAREQQTPLHIAARLGNVDNVVLLLQHGASPNATTKDLYTPLHIAAKEGHEEVAAALLDQGADHSLTTKKGFTPLHIAAKYGNIKVARLLLLKDADPDVQGKNGLTPLHVATHYNHVNVALLLLDNKASPHAVAKNGYTPLHIAAKKNQMDIATTLLEFGAKPNAESKNGFTPLHLASQEGHTDMVSLLLEHNANVNAQASNGLAPIHLAAQEDKVNVAEVLVKFGSEIDPQTKAGYTPLHTACHFGQTNMVRFLLDHNASVSSTTKLGYTPLHQAAQQGHVMVINLLLKNKASPNAVTNNGQTALSIAQRLGYISVVDTLKTITEVTETLPTSEDKYRVVAPETMQETMLSDSEDEGEDSISIEKGDITSPLDLSFDKQQDYLDHQVMSHTFASHPENRYLNNTMDNSRYSSYSGSSFNTSFDPDNVAVDRTPTCSGKLKWKSFLVSFMVDARGGAMRGSRHSGVRIIIPPRKAYMPTRVTCKLIKREKLSHPPPLNEGEALASRILEMGPVGVKFLGPVIIEVPHFASLRGKEREIVIIRCDDGEKWTEHPMQATEEAVNETLNGSFEELDQEEELTAKRITRILTTDFPMYFAIVTRIRQENQTIGSEGGMLSSTVVPQVQTIFPEGALTKKIPVGLQAQPIAPELVAKMLGNRVAVSPIVTVEPRRRKFHKPITLTIPVPRAAQKGMINQYGGDAPTLRLLCSISGKRGTTPAVWEDITASTQLTFVNDCVSFTTTVSARFWLMDCQNVNEASRMATELYQEAVVVPFMAKFVIFAKRHAQEEGRLRMFCMTDDKVDKTLEKQEKFIEVARSRDVEVLQGRPQYVEMAGNLIPVTKSGDQLYVHFRAFRENRLPCTVKVRDLDQEPAARVAFMKEPKVARGEAPQSPICNLNIVLPDVSKSDSMEMTSEEALEVRKRHSLLREHGIVLQDTISRAQMKITDVADTLQGDWVMLAQQLDITMSEINKIKTEYNTVNDQALAMLHLWVEKNGDKASGNALEKALIRISREDVAKKCMYDVVTFEDEMEMAAGRVAMDQSGFDTFKEEVGISRDSSMKRGLSLDVSYDEQDMIKESESAEESGSDADTEKHRLAKVPSEPTSSREEEAVIKIVDSRRPETVSPKDTVQQKEMTDRKKDAFVALAEQLDSLADQEEKLKPVETLQEDEKKTVNEGLIISKEKGTTSVSSAIKETVSSEPINKEVVEKEIIDKEQISQAMAPCVDISGSRASSSSSISEPEQKEISPRIKTPPPSPTEVVPPGEHVSERSELETKERLTEELVDSQHTPRETVNGNVTTETIEEKEYEENLPDGTRVEHKLMRLCSKTSEGPVEETIEYITRSEAPREETKVEDYEEVLDDGTVHHIKKIKKHSITHLQKEVVAHGNVEKVFEGDVDVPGTEHLDTLEIFETLPRSEKTVETIEEKSPSGKVHERLIVKTRMVQKVKTKHESFDADNGKVAEEYEISEVIPGTETAFYDDQASLSNSESETEGSIEHHVMVRDSIETSETSPSQETPSSMIVDQSVDPSEMSPCQETPSSAAVDQSAESSETIPCLETPDIMDADSSETTTGKKTPSSVMGDESLEPSGTSPSQETSSYIMDDQLAEPSETSPYEETPSSVMGDESVEPSGTSLCNETRSSITSNEPVEHSETTPYQETPHSIVEDHAAEPSETSPYEETPSSVTVDHSAEPSETSHYQEMTPTMIEPSEIPGSAETSSSVILNNSVEPPEAAPYPETPSSNVVDHSIKLLETSPYQETPVQVDHSIEPSETSPYQETPVQVDHTIEPSETSPYQETPTSESLSDALTAGANEDMSEIPQRMSVIESSIGHELILPSESPDPMNIQEEASHMKPEEREGIDVAADSETDDGSQATSLMMKKEIHKKTYIRDGRDETFIQEESRVEQQNETPEELRESMQQIIDQFMQTPSDFDQRQCLEDDV